MTRPMYKAPLRNLNAVPQTVAAVRSNLYGIQIENNQGAEAWIQVFDKAAPTPGTDAPDKEFKVPANSTRTYSFQPQGSLFANAITVASTTTEKGAIGSAPGVQVFVDYE